MEILAFSKRVNQLKVWTSNHLDIRRNLCLCLYNWRFIWFSNLTWALNLFKLSTFIQETLIYLTSINACRLCTGKTSGSSHKLYNSGGKCFTCHFAFRIMKPNMVTPVCRSSSGFIALDYCCSTFRTINGGSSLGEFRIMKPNMVTPVNWNIKNDFMFW